MYYHKLTCAADKYRSYSDKLRTYIPAQTDFLLGTFSMREKKRTHLATIEKVIKFRFDDPQLVQRNISSSLRLMKRHAQYPSPDRSSWCIP